VTKKEFFRLQKTLEPELPQFICRGDIMYLSPTESLLRGISFYSSGFSKTAFYVSVFVMLLSVPATCLVLSHSKRLLIDGKFDAWDSNKPELQEDLLKAIQEQGLPFLESVSSLPDFIAYTKGSPSNIRTLEVVGYAMARSGRVDEAIETFEQIMKVDPQYQWVADLQSQVLSLSNQLKRDPLNAQIFLAQNEMATRQILKLPQPVGTF
jgi:hypothetical protein